jgi:rhodanese-related sulfurtransferase/predicted transcriptional regulator
MTSSKADGSRRFKDPLYEQFARVGKALACANRLELLDLLAQAPRTVDALAEATGMTTANASQHLQVLRAAGLVEAQKEGLFVTCELADDVAALYLAVRRVAEKRLAEVDRIARDMLAEYDALEPVDKVDLVRRMKRGSVTILDVRPREEFDAGHLPGALCVPLPELKDRLATLPRSKTIVAYCRGPFCVYALEAVRLLRKRGLRAVRFDESVAEWRARGLPLERAGKAAR